MQSVPLIFVSQRVEVMESIETADYFMEAGGNQASLQLEANWVKIPPKYLIKKGKITQVHQWFIDPPCHVKSLDTVTSSYWLAFSLS